MLLCKPSYYDSFRCLAGACPDSCCRQWSVAVDEDSAAYYRGLPGALGDRLRAFLTQEDGCTVLALEDGRCPMWRCDGLCRLQAELGEQALCDTCRDFPRIRHDFGDFTELQLELSCPEAARLILESPAAPAVKLPAEGGEAPEYDKEDMAARLALREQLLSPLSQSTLAPEQALLAFLRLGTGEAALPSPEPRLDWVVDAYRELEMLTDRWPQLLSGAGPRPLDPRAPAMARYLTERYLLQYPEEELADVYGKTIFITAACILVGSLPGDFIQNAQLWSKEIENSDCNPSRLIFAAYTDDAFTPENLAALLSR